MRARAFALDEDVFRLGPRSPLVAQRGERRAPPPLLELLNHRSGARVRLERSEKSWRLIAEDACAAGEQVFNCYGERANLELLLHYGFALGDNARARVGFDCRELLDGVVAARPREFARRARARASARASPRRRRRCAARRCRTSRSFSSTRRRASRAPRGPARG